MKAQGKSEFQWDALEKDMFCSVKSLTQHLSYSRSDRVMKEKKDENKKAQADIMNCSPFSQDKFSMSRSPRLPLSHFESRPHCSRNPFWSFAQ